MKCDYCDKEAEYLITRLMQPSFVHPACKECKDSQHSQFGIMIVKDLKND